MDASKGKDFCYPCLRQGGTDTAFDEREGQTLITKPRLCRCKLKSHESRSRERSIDDLWQTIF